ncbi:unnamed protein product, partial [Larinioides sclopetarius]
MSVPVAKPKFRPMKTGKGTLYRCDECQIVWIMLIKILF